MKKHHWYIILIFVLLLASCSTTEGNDPGENEDTERVDETVSEDPSEADNSEDGPDASDENSEATEESTSEEDASDNDTNEEEENYPVGSSQNLNVLFVGNSLTYYNDLPALVKKEADARSITLTTTMEAYPNYAIIDHWEDGKVQELIAKEAYDFVIIQQGPSSQAFGREVLMTYGRRFKDLCETYGTKLVYYMVWPSVANFHTFEDVIKNHRDAAEANNALLSPVGEVWKQDIEFTDDYSYYGDDQFHPSLKGSKVAARVIGNTIFNN